MVGGAHPTWGPMPNYRRVREGRTYFFTVVTYGRKRILCLDRSLTALRDAIRETRRTHPFEIDAWVLLPDHMHCIWTLPEDDMTRKRGSGLES